MSNARSTTPTPFSVPDSAGPVFISYRRNDGAEIAAELAWILRASGIPVWRDLDDLPPGDTEERLEQAVAEGLSGGVLVVTPDIVNSRIVKQTEAPGLIEFHEAHPQFALAIANDVKYATGGTDYTAPDRLLERRPGNLSGVDQKPADRAGLLALSKKLVQHRIAQHRDIVAADARTLSITVQTRNSAQVYDRTGAQLDIRIRRSNHDRLPDVDGLRDLKDTIDLLSDSYTRAGAQRVRLGGGAHLSVALAIGAALPTTRVRHTEVVDLEGDTWANGPVSSMSATPLTQIVQQGSNPALTLRHRPPVAMYVDMLQQRSDAAFQRFLDERGDTFAAWSHFRLTVDGPIDPADAAWLAGEIAMRLREISSEHGNAEVHLLLRCPFALAVLVGTRLNTLRVVAYEWDDANADSPSDHRPVYVPALRICPSSGAGVIEEVLLTVP